MAAPTAGGRAGGVALRAAGPVLVAAAWWLAAHASPLVASVIPPPDAVVAALAAQIASGDLVTHVGNSLWRAVLGLSAAAAIGVPLGLAMGSVPLLRAILAPALELLRPISSIAWIPLAILWFGIGIGSVVFVIFIAAVFIVLLNTIAGVAEVQADLVKAARTLGAGRATIFFKVVVPSALPRILLGLRIALAAAWGGVIVAEMIASQNGVGYLIHRGQMTMQPTLVIGGMVVIAIAGYALNRAFLVAERRLLHVR